MPYSLKYDFQSWNRVANRLRRLASDYKDETDKTVGAWTKQQRATMKGWGYPAPKRGRQPFKTERQRRFFFWALANGVIQVPYPRTGRLANSWSARKTGASSWTLANSMPNAAWVIGRGRQSKYHEGHWWTAEDIIEGNVKELSEQLTEELEDLF